MHDHSDDEQHIEKRLAEEGIPTLQLKMAADDIARFLKALHEGKREQVKVELPDGTDMLMVISEAIKAPGMESRANQHRWAGRQGKPGPETSNDKDRGNTR